MISGDPSSEKLKVLAVCAFPHEAAATRFRLSQYVEPLKERNIELTISPFLRSAQFQKLYESGGSIEKAFSLMRSVLRRVAELPTLRKYDLVLVQREAMLFGPAVFEWLYTNIGRLPLVLDLDDATYIKYISPTYGRFGSALKFFGKTDNLIRRASIVICGNRYIAEHARSNGGGATVSPTVVDLDLFCPNPLREQQEATTIGWIGTHSTFPFLRKILPVLERLATEHDLILKIVGAGKIDLPAGKIRIEKRDWELEREVQDFRTLDIGLYPIFPEGAAGEEWIKGKSGFKAIQYMAVGVPFVMSPIGICAELGVDGETHFNAVTEEDWYTALSKLLNDRNLRTDMGKAGRQYALQNFDVQQQADKLADVLRSVLSE
jgi:glycosyltransferase involved in cell wall biosynthesis